MVRSEWVMPSEGAGSLIENKISKNQIASFPFVESTHFILLARNEPHRSSMFICSCSKADCPHVLLHGAGEREDSVALHALHGWDFIQKLLWCIISTLLNSSDTSFHKSLLGCQVRLTWRSCNSITATRCWHCAFVPSARTWMEWVHSCSISWLYIVTRSWRKVILRLQCCFSAGAEHWFIWSTITRRQSKL